MTSGYNTQGSRQTLSLIPIQVEEDDDDENLLCEVNQKYSPNHYKATCADFIKSIHTFAFVLFTKKKTEKGKNSIGMYKVWRLRAASPLVKREKERKMAALEKKMTPTLFCFTLSFCA